ncbi:hypothetical protein LS77_005135 [Helicobacter bilis]|uniref:Uncharacterized protein n=2 Tax=Helicobacter bilis TaxID=37372 RepID=A0A6D2C8Q1_9HELI|nr:hypothetical protein [Helicobacter bilis]EMZ38448.1 hypothetical protein C826_01484 [Helicobacter bilis WiWa]TLE04763.1 hypothetical protein LS77_005135 [Helicobacter bilis]TLE06032.1 hypothetical protein LS76_004105 [Helicobacter bilis]
MASADMYNLNPQDIAHDFQAVPQDTDFYAEIGEKFIAPLLSGSAYHVAIKEFNPLAKSPLLTRYNEFGLTQELQKGYRNEYNIVFYPYVVSFDFHYNNVYLDNLRTLFAQLSNKTYCSNEAIRNLKDLRHFDMSCVAFGDFDLEYIEREGWYGIKHFYLDNFQAIPLEYSRLLAQKLHRLSSYLYFSFTDSTQEHIVGVYSDFRDYSLECYNTKMERKISRLLANTKRTTFATYQVEPLSPMALSYRLRSFFLVREKAEENSYAFIIFLSEEEISRITNIRAYAKAE